MRLKKANPAAPRLIDLRKVPVVILFFLFVGLPLLGLRAQPAAVRQLEDTRRKMESQPSLLSMETNKVVPLLYPDESSDVGRQRILKIKPHRTWFEVFADTQYFYTDNTFLSGKPTVSTCVAVNTVQVALSPTPFNVGHGKIAPSLGVRSQWYNYGLDGADKHLDFLNFNAQTAFLSARYRFGKDWEVYGGLDYPRLLDQDRYIEFYHEYVPALGIQRTFSLRDNLLMTTSLQTAYHFSEVAPFPRSDINDRWDNSFIVSLTYQPAPRLIVQPYYRFQYTQYPRTAFDTKRNDYLNTVGLAVAYNFNRNLSARIFIAQDFKHSDDSSVPDYNQFSAGLGASVIFRF
jgi:hypothetical protein